MTDEKKAAPNLYEAYVRQGEIIKRVVSVAFELASDPTNLERWSVYLALKEALGHEYIDKDFEQRARNRLTARLNEELSDSTRDYRD